MKKYKLITAVVILVLMVVLGGGVKSFIFADEKKEIVFENIPYRDGLDSISSSDNQILPTSKDSVFLSSNESATSSFSGFDDCWRTNVLRVSDMDGNLVDMGNAGYFVGDVDNNGKNDITAIGIITKKNNFNQIKTFIERNIYLRQDDSFSRVTHCGNPFDTSDTRVSPFLFLYQQCTDTSGPIPCRFSSITGSIKTGVVNYYQPSSRKLEVWNMDKQRSNSCNYALSEIPVNTNPSILTNDPKSKILGVRSIDATGDGHKGQAILVYKNNDRIHGLRMNDSFGSLSFDVPTINFTSSLDANLIGDKISANVMNYGDFFGNGKSQFVYAYKDGNDPTRGNKINISYATGAEGNIEGLPYIDLKFKDEELVPLTGSELLNFKELYGANADMSKADSSVLLEVTCNLTNGKKAIHYPFQPNRSTICGENKQLGSVYTSTCNGNGEWTHTACPDRHECRVVSGNAVCQPLTYQELITSSVGGTSTVTNRGCERTCVQWTDKENGICAEWEIVGRCPPLPLYTPRTAPATYLPKNAAVTNQTFVVDGVSGEPNYWILAQADSKYTILQSAVLTGDLNGDGKDDMVVIGGVTGVERLFYTKACNITDINFAVLGTGTSSGIFGTGFGTIEKYKDYCKAEVKKPNKTAYMGWSGLGMAKAYVNKTQGFDKVSFDPVDKIITADMYFKDGVILDHNKDGYGDLIIIAESSKNNQEGEIFIYHGNGDGTFRDPIRVKIGMNPRSMIRTDLDQKGGENDFLYLTGLGNIAYWINSCNKVTPPSIDPKLMELIKSLSSANASNIIGILREIARLSGGRFDESTIIDANAQKYVDEFKNHPPNSPEGVQSGVDKSNDLGKLVTACCPNGDVGLGIENGDFNCNGKIDIEDRSIWLNEFIEIQNLPIGDPGRKKKWCSISRNKNRDENGAGFVTMEDRNTWLLNFIKIQEGQK